ncbi:MAG: tryptophan synthase subunit alpha [Candidatus Tritonobacter lacicola]|nr:tryptophan synthase subunit alpha [Candidatus Tritonobacter lacicola]
MSRIRDRFNALSKEGRKGLIAYITAGDPDLETTMKLAVEFEKRGVSFLELGVPFSDPLADGKTNQEAAERALKSGTTLKGILKSVSGIRGTVTIPLIIFSYYNPIFKYGVEAFARDASEAGIDGALVLDLPPEECRPYKEAMRKSGLDTIFLVAPTSTAGRIQAITKVSGGFIYCLSRTGVTGEREAAMEVVKTLTTRVRGFTDLPLAVGFGIATPEQAAAVARYADAVVVGSAIVRAIKRNIGRGDLVERVGDFVETLVNGLPRSNQDINNH